MIRHENWTPASLCSLDPIMKVLSPIFNLFGGGSSDKSSAAPMLIPSTPPQVSAPPPPPSVQSPAAQQAGSRQRAKAAAIAGSTIATSSQGVLGDAFTGKKKLTGE